MSAHLRLVRTPGPKEPKKKRDRRPPMFTEAEEQRLRAALKNARALFGSWPCLGDAMHVSHEVLVRTANGHAPVTAETAVRLAKALGVALESLYAPPRPASKCPMCGQGGAS